MMVIHSIILLNINYNYFTIIIPSTIKNDGFKKKFFFLFYIKIT